MLQALQFVRVVRQLFFSGFEHPKVRVNESNTTLL